MSGLQQRTMSGVRWMAVSQAIGQVARLAFSVLLARMIAPAEFGVFQMAVVFTSFGALLCDVGLGAALIQRTEIEERQLTATFWLSMTVSLVTALVLCALSAPLAHLCGNRIVGLLICVASADFILSSLAIVHRALLIRAMDYRSLAVAELTGIWLGGAAAVATAFIGGGVWSLAVFVIVTTACTTAMLWWLKPWRPALVLRGMIRRELLGFGLHLQGFNVVNYWLRNLDKFLIGKFFGDVSLGLYGRAWSTMLLPQSQVTAVLERVMWPALARCSGDVDRLRAAYLRALRLVCFFSFPLLMGLALVAADFVRLLYGSAWMGCVTTLQLLCIVGLAQTPVATLGWLYLATGRTRLLFRWGLGAGLLYCAGIVAGLFCGTIEAVAGIYAGVAVLLVVPAFVVAAPCAALSVGPVVRAVTGSLVLSIVTTGLIALVLHGPGLSWTPIARLLFAGFAGAGFFVGAAWLFRMPEARDMAEVARSMLKGKAAA